MTKADLVDKIHAKSGLSTKAATESFLDAALTVLSETLAKGRWWSAPNARGATPAPTRTASFLRPAS